MTLADNLHLGDRLQVAPHWEYGEHNATPAAQIATVVYIHPEGRYCTVRFANGLTDTVQTVPAERVAAPVPGRYDISARTPHSNYKRPNMFLRDWLKGMPVSQREVSAAMGHYQSWLSHRLDRELTREERDAITETAERIAAERTAHDPV